MNDQEIPVPSSTQPVSRSELVRQIGQTLQERRSARSLTLEKVTQAIKIRIPFLDAIEKGDWDQLPGEVFVRGFVRRYAQYLGLDGDKLIAPYITLSNSPIERKSGPSSAPDRPAEFGRTQMIWGFLGVLFIIGFLKVIKQDRAVPGKPMAALPASQQPPPLQAPPKPEEAKPVLNKHRIEVFSPLPLWLRVSASAKSFEGFIPQDSTWTWSGEGEITVRLGHTKQVLLTFDGDPVPLGEDHKKVVLPSNEN